MPSDRSATTGWIIYDLANTIFALGVVGLYLPFWLHDNGLADSALALTEAAAGVAVIVIAPWLGARTDRTGRRLPALAITTMAAVVATAALATGPTFLTLIMLGFGLIGFNLGSAVYDALLPLVSTPSTWGRVSGLGVAVGYLGSFIGLGLGRLAFDVWHLGYPGVFRLLAAGFGLFSIPIFLLVREHPVRTRAARPTSSPLSSFLNSWKAARTVPGLIRFLVGRFLYADAINTLIGGFLAIFVITELGLNPNQVNNLLGLAIAAAMAGGLGGGRLVARLGARAALRLVLLLWAGAISLGAAAALTETVGIVWVVGLLGGLALGATWAADRVLMIELSPPDRLGEFYGLYATVGRFATILGPLVWAAIVDGAGWGREAAMMALATFVVAAWWVLGPRRASAI